MARSRNIKPGFFLNDKLAEVEPLGDYFCRAVVLGGSRGAAKGQAQANKAEVLPYDSCDIDKLLNDLWRHGFIIRYEVDGERFIQVVNFLKHQNPHHKEPKARFHHHPKTMKTPLIQAHSKHKSSMSQA